MSQRVLHIIGLILAVASGILAISDQLVLITSLNPSLAHAWPVVLASATAIDRLGKLLVKPTPAGPAKSDTSA